MTSKEDDAAKLIQEVGAGELIMQDVQEIKQALLNCLEHKFGAELVYNLAPLSKFERGNLALNFLDVMKEFEMEASG